MNDVRDSSQEVFACKSNCRFCAKVPLAPQYLGDGVVALAWI